MSELSFEQQLFEQPTTSPVLDWFARIINGEVVAKTIDACPVSAKNVCFDEGDDE